MNLSSKYLQNVAVPFYVMIEDRLVIERSRSET